ncbi:MAG: hypothetical protein ACI36V_08360 [Coriobacteriales bacterium]
MAKAIIHIGTHKTGTTAIQGFLAANAARLRERGFEFPVFPVRWPEQVSPDRNGYFLNRAALHACDGAGRYPDAPQVEMCARMLADRLPAMEGSVILTDERMWYSASTRPGYWEKLRAIAEGLGFDSFEVVVYLRRQDEFAESLWNQFVKATKKTEALEEYLQKPQVRAMCDYQAGLERLERAFGRESIKVGFYSRELLLNGDSIDDFALRMLGIDSIAGWDRGKPVDSNMRLSNTMAEMKRLINMAPEYQRASGNFMGRNLADAVSVISWEGEQGSILGDEQRREFMRQFAEGNRAVAERYCSGPANPLAFRPGGRPAWECDDGKLLRDAIVMFSDVVSLQHRRIMDLERRLSALEGERNHPAGQQQR